MSLPNSTPNPTVPVWHFPDNAALQFASGDGSEGNPFNGLIVSSNGASLGAGKGAATATFTAAAAAYSANTVMGGAQQFPNLGPAGGGEVIITSAHLEVDANTLQAGEANYNLYLYSVTPPSAIADQGAFDIPSGDRVAYLGKIALGIPVDEGSTLVVDADGINKQITVPSGGAVFGYLVTVAGFTATAVARKVTLHATGA
jgi:hypothetical protein